MSIEIQILITNIKFRAHVNDDRMLTKTTYRSRILPYRWVRGDMIETFKILSGKYDTNVVPHLKTTGIHATRDN